MTPDEAQALADRTLDAIAQGVSVGSCYGHDYITHSIEADRERVASDLALWKYADEAVRDLHPAASWRYVRATAEAGLRLTAALYGETP